MKYLIVLGVVLLVLWFARTARRGDAAPPARRPAMRPDPEEMVRCAHCGVHLPRREALVADQSLYCSEAHRAAGPAR